MKFTILPLIAASLMTAVQAQSSFDVALKVFTDANFAGANRQFFMKDSGCVYVSNEFNDKISSLQIFPNGYYCTFYDDGSCRFGGQSFSAGNTNYVGDAYNDRISSFRCFKTV